MKTNGPPSAAREILDGVSLLMKFIPQGLDGWRPTPFVGFWIDFADVPK